LNQTVDKIGPIIKKLSTDIAFETKALRERKYKNMDKIHVLGDELKAMGRKLKPFMRLLVHVIEDDCFSAGVTIYLRDVLDNLEIYDDEVKALISSCESVDNAAENFQARQMDQTLYYLTVISATFLPAQFLTGVWGMNFENMPELEQEWGYRLFWILTVGLFLSAMILLNFGRLH